MIVSVACCCYRLYFFLHVLLFSAGISPLGRGDVRDVAGKSRMPPDTAYKGLYGVEDPWNLVSRRSSLSGV